MSHAQTLITAIQTCNPARVRDAIAQLNRVADSEVQHLTGSERLWARKNYINDRLPGGLDITGLHLAAKAYAAHADNPSLAKSFNQMVSDLLDAGAMPWLEMGCKPVKDRVGAQEMERLTVGQTVLEVCVGRMPPALVAWVSQNCDDNSTIKGFCEKKHDATIRHRDAKREAWRDRKRDRVEAAELEELEEETMGY